MDANEYLTSSEDYFKLIDRDFLDELDLLTTDSEVKTDFKVAYLILYFQLSKDGGYEKNILLGDLFISILTRRLIRRNSSLLKKIMEAISGCHSECILWKIKCYKRGLLKIVEEGA